MKYDHAVIAHGTFYPAGAEVPADFGKASVDDPRHEETAEVKSKRSHKPVQEKAEC